MRGRGRIVRRLLRCGKAAFVLGVFVAAGAVGLDHLVTASTTAHVHEDITRCPEAPVALVLGVAKESHGRPNRFYFPRLRAAAELYLTGKVRGLLVSGDNSRPDYDEPTQMKADLVRLGVPARYITLDYAGFRTWDSVVRARRVFGLDRFVVVSQRFHCERAVALARQMGCDAHGYCAASVRGYWGVKNRLREILARSRAAVDVVLGTKPRYLGDSVQVALAPASVGSRPTAAD